MNFRALLLWCVFRFLGYTVRVHRERFDLGTMKVLLIIGYNALEGACVEVLPKGYATTIDDYDTRQMNSPVQAVLNVYHEY